VLRRLIWRLLVAVPFPGTATSVYGLRNTDEEHLMQGKCSKCEAVPNIVVVPLRARDEVSKTTIPVLQFLCDQCRTILSIALDPEWQAQVVAGQLRSVGERSSTSH
jgi:hypothetical protein